MTAQLPAFDASTTLVTVNKRLAAALRNQHDDRQVAGGAIVWQSPDILPWGAWLQRLYAQLVDSGHCQLDLLTRPQEMALWEQIVGRRGELPLMRPGGAAELASEAHTRCRDWALTADEINATEARDTQVFARWYEAFGRIAERRGFTTAADLPHVVEAAFSAGHLAPPARLYHAGFDRLTPAQRALLDTLAERGCTVGSLPTTARHALCRRLVAADSAHEIRAAAHWANDRLAENPTARLAIVSPTLSAHRKAVERILTEALAPANYLGDARVEPPFNLSLGEPLADKALVAHGLLVLRLLVGDQTLDRFGQLLRSPFVGGFPDEWERRAVLDTLLRADGRPRLGLRDLIRRLSRLDATDPAACPDLLERLAALAGLQSASGRTGSPATRVEQLREALQQAGWPGQHTLDSTEFQQYQRFLELFDDLAALGKVRRHLSLGEAVGVLGRLASETVFQPQTAPRPVQVLGVLEAAGMQFDAIWLLGMDDRNWPPMPHPNPLLPTGLQRRLDMPQASADGELAFATRLTEGLTQATHEVIASHALSEDEQQLMPSPLIADWPQVELATLVGDSPTSLQDAWATTTGWLTMPKPEAGPGPDAARGGAALLAMQARCPFAAVGLYRLHARPLDEPSHTPDAAMTGSLVHRLLERIWSVLEDADTLARHDAAGLRRLITPLAEQTLVTARHRRPDLYTERFCQLETRRLTELMVSWLEVERQRNEAFTVVGLELAQAVTVNGLRLDTRVDRIDRLADGSVAVIDYKTGRNVGEKGWLDDRLSEPQLPLYAVAAGRTVCAALLGRVRRDQTGCRLIGVSEREDFGSAVKSPQAYEEGLDWAGLLAHWRASLDELAAEFVAGRADPTPSPAACGYCPLGGLCRVQQRLTEDEGDESDG